MGASFTSESAAKSGMAGTARQAPRPGSTRRGALASFFRVGPVPFAAASVAQVHSARTFSGREVIVKVLRPGVAIQVDRDMQILASIVHFLARFSPTLQRYKAEAVVREIWSNLKRELDLAEEARAAHPFAQAFA